MDGLKRFWTDVALTGSAGGYAVALDQRPIRTPAKQTLTLPTRALAEAVAEEWRSQGEVVSPDTMPQTRYANSVIDGIIPHREEIVAAIAAYGASDLLCYRAGHPEELIMQQTERWDPLLDWARETYDAPLILTTGVMPVTQPKTSLERLRHAVDGHDNFSLAGLHDLVSISGSLILGLGVSAGRLQAAEALSLSRLDDEWQISQWGHDDEAAAVAARKAADFEQAARLMRLIADR